MAGTFNSKNGYLTVTGMHVDDIVVGNKFSVDSDWVVGLITPAIANLNLDSDVVAAIAKAIDLNDLIDSEQIDAIAATAIANSNTDSEHISIIANAAAAIVQTNVDTVTANLALTDAKNAEQDSDVADMRVKYATIYASDTLQSTNIATNTADITTLSTRITTNDSDIGGIKADVTAIYGRTTAAETAATALTTRTTALETAVGNVGGGGHEARITTLETDLAALQATVAALTLNDLTDVDTTGLAVGDVLEWNGTDFVPVATS